MKQDVLLTLTALLLAPLPWPRFGPVSNPFSWSTRCIVDFDVQRIPPRHDRALLARERNHASYFSMLALIVLILTTRAGHAAEYPCRWVYVARGLHVNRDVEDIREIVETASRHGRNGMVLAAGLDHLDRQPEAYFRRPGEIKQLCAGHHIEIIPIVFSAGYGGSVLACDRNLAEGIPVKDERLRQGSSSRRSS